MYARMTHRASSGLPASARMSGGNAEIIGPISGMKHTSPEKMPRKSAPGTPIRYRAPIDRPPTIDMETSRPPSQLMRLARTSERRPLTSSLQGEYPNHPLHDGLGHRR